MNLLPSLLALYNLLALCAQSASTSDAIRDSYQVQLLTLDKEVGTLHVHLEAHLRGLFHHQICSTGAGSVGQKWTLRKRWGPESGAFH